MVAYKGFRNHTGALAERGGPARCDRAIVREPKRSFGGGLGNRDRSAIG